MGEWLRKQPKWIAVRLVPRDRAAALYPALAPHFAQDELVVVSDDGGVYLSDHAWLMCLYAMRNYRHWATRLAGPAMLPFARQAFALLSHNRQRLSRWLGLLSDAELAAELRPVSVPRCYGTGQ